jgi:hypothetical protein
LDTFTDRGVRFTLDTDLDAVGSRSIRDFVGRYLNAGRLSNEVLIELGSAYQDSGTTNACLSCPDLKPCHKTFGTSAAGHGLYPFNGAALNQLVSLASPDGFRPREILREVIRAPLETAEEEFRSHGMFPSEDFAKVLDEGRRQVPLAMRTSVRRENLVNPEAELSLRAFYAQLPPAADPELERIAEYFGIQLTPGIDEVQEELGEQEDDKDLAVKPRKVVVDEVERWANGEMLAAQTANAIRRWVCEAVITHLQTGAYGLPIRKPRKNVNEWQIGSYLMRTTDVAIERAMGSGAHSRSAELRIDATDENAILIRGILGLLRGGSLDSVDQGRWFFRLQTKVSRFAEALAGLAANDAAASLASAVQVLTVLRYAASNPGVTVRDALPASLMLVSPVRPNLIVSEFLKDVRSARDEALTVLRDHATAAKGAGKPSLLDVGPIYQEIRTHLKARCVEGEFDGDNQSARPLKTLQTKQLRTFTRVWADVTKAVEDVARFVSPDEDLTATLKVVDRLVSDGHARGMLPRADSRAIYEDARANVDVEIFDLYRRLSRKVAGSGGPGDLWDVLEDPLPILATLGQYAVVTNELLSGLETNLINSDESEEAGTTDALIEEFRGLSDVLDALANEGEG